MSFSIVIFANSELDFKSAKDLVLKESNFSGKIHFCSSKKTTRLNFLKNNPNEWFLFLDADCTVDAAAVAHLEGELIDKNEIQAGHYENPRQASYMQRVHNFVANTWLKSSYLFPNINKKLLGGAFLIFADPEKLKYASEPQELFWGAEDKLLSQQLLSAGFNLLLESDFKVTHNTSKKISHFVRRAWLQGYNDNFGQNPNHQKPKERLEIKYWLSELAKTNLWLAPAVLVHFLILQSGKLFQIVRPRHNKASLK